MKPTDELHKLTKELEPHGVESWLLVWKMEGSYGAFSIGSLTDTMALLTVANKKVHDLIDGANDTYDRNTFH